MTGNRVAASLVSVLGVILLATAPAESRFSTFWGGVSAETLRVSKVAPQHLTYSGLLCSIDADGDFTLVYPGGYTLAGSTEGGTTSFRMIPDAASGDAMQDYLEDSVIEARNMDVFFLAKFRWKMKARIRNGSQLVIQSTAKGSGVGAVGIENRRAAVSSKEAFTLSD